MERSPNRNSTCSNIYIGVALSEREELEMHGRGSYSQSPARSSSPQRIIMGIG